MITQTAEYALRAVVDLAQHGGGSAITEDIAERTKTPVGYMRKVLRALARRGVLNVRRGIGGGFTLARPAEEISILEVLEATDAAPQRIRRCPLGIPGHVRLCSLHAALDESIETIETRFAATSIADLIRPNGRVQALCERPGPARAALSVRGASAQDRSASPVVKRSRKPTSKR